MKTHPALHSEHDVFSPMLPPQPKFIFKQSISPTVLIQIARLHTKMMYLDMFVQGEGTNEAVLNKKLVKIKESTVL